MKFAWGGWGPSLVITERCCVVETVFRDCYFFGAVLGLLKNVERGTADSLRIGTCAGPGSLYTYGTKIPQTGSKLILVILRTVQ